MSLKIYIGKNKTGKSKELESVNNDFIKQENNLVLYLPAELDLEEYITKENLGTTAKPIISPQVKVINFINEIYKYCIEIKLEEKQIKEIKKNEEFLENITNDLKNENENDIFFERETLNFFKLKSFDEKKPLNYIFNPLEIIKLKSEQIKNASSGTKFYSLLKMLCDFLKILDKYPDFKKEQIKIKNFKIILDEPEKFCHPELIDKIANQIYDLSLIFDIVIATHSNLLVEKIFKKQSFFERNEDIEYIYFYKEKEKFKKLNLNLFNELIDANSRRISLIIKCLFSSNVILVEGLADELFLNDILFEINSSSYITIIDTNDRIGVEKCKEILVHLGLSKIINILIFYDLDDKDPINIKDNPEITSIIQNKNIEIEFFGKEISKKIYKIANGEVHKDKIVWTKKWINKNSLLPNIEIILNQKIELIKNWIKSIEGKND
ncbi:MAG: TOPRIM nucleotidyl transferase/hydrolase domain-containing protein [Metamycoplasmataceae bacterium]